eukprot:15794-Heterococcus_DN1.PRE.3
MMYKYEVTRVEGSRVDLSIIRNGAAQAFRADIVLKSSACCSTEGALTKSQSLAPGMPMLEQAQRLHSSTRSALIHRQ